MNFNTLKSLHIDGLVQDCSNSSALALELLQSCTKPSIYKNCSSADPVYMQDPNLVITMCLQMSLHLM